MTIQAPDATIVAYDNRVYDDGEGTIGHSPASRFGSLNV